MFGAAVRLAPAVGGTHAQVRTAVDRAVAAARGTPPGPVHLNLPFSEPLIADDPVGHVPWWPPEFREVTLQHILLHTIAESHRPAGHADILRELIDGSAGFLDRGDMLLDGDAAWWQRDRDRLEHVARHFC